MKSKRVFVKHFVNEMWYQALGVQMQIQNCSSRHQEAATNYTRVKSEGHCARMGSSPEAAPKPSPSSPSSQVKQLSHLCPPLCTSSLTQARLVGTPVPASQPPYAPDTEVGSSYSNIRMLYSSSFYHHILDILIACITS